MADGGYFNFSNLVRGHGPLPVVGTVGGMPLAPVHLEGTSPIDPKKREWVRAWARVDGPNLGEMTVVFDGAQDVAQLQEELEAVGEFKGYGTPPPFQERWENQPVSTDNLDNHPDLAAKEKRDAEAKAVKDKWMENEVANGRGERWDEQVAREAEAEERVGPEEANEEANAAVRDFLSAGGPRVGERGNYQNRVRVGSELMGIEPPEEESPRVKDPKEHAEIVRSEQGPEYLAEVKAYEARQALEMGRAQARAHAYLSGGLTNHQAVVVAKGIRKASQAEFDLEEQIRLAEEKALDREMDEDRLGHLDSDDYRVRVNDSQAKVEPPEVLDRELDEVKEVRAITGHTLSLNLDNLSTEDRATVLAIALGGVE